MYVRTQWFSFFKEIYLSSNCLFEMFLMTTITRRPLMWVKFKARPSKVFLGKNIQKLELSSHVNTIDLYTVTELTKDTDNIRESCQ